MPDHLKNEPPPRTCQSVCFSADMHLLVLFMACACTFATQSEYKAFDAEFLDSLTPPTNTRITCHAGPSAGVIVTGHYVVVTRTHTLPCTAPTNTPDGDSGDQSHGCPRSMKRHCNCHEQSYDNDMIGEEYV